MNQWSFVTAAYALVLAGTGGLILLSFVAMRRAEADVEAAGRGR